MKIDTKILMKIDTKSIFYRWNRRVVDFGFDKYKRFPTNVCALFWFIVAAHVIAIAKVLVIAFISAIVIFLIVIGYLYPFAFAFPAVHEFFMLSEGARMVDSPLIILSIGIWGATLVILGVVLLVAVINSEWYTKWEKKRFEKRVNNHLDNQRTGETSSGWWDVVTAYIKSKKDKVCPTVEYVHYTKEKVDES